MKLKSTIALILAMLMVFSLVGCGNNEPATPTEGPTNNTDPPSNNNSSIEDLLGGEEISDSVVKETVAWWRGPTDTYTTADTGLERKLSNDTLVFRLSMVIGCDPNSYLDEHSWCYNVYEPLIQKDWETGEIHPLLATDWGYNDDGTYHITLRDDVTFHSGNHMTAKDVLFTFQRVANYSANKASAAMKAIDFDACVIENDYNLTIVFAKPAPAFEPVLCTGYTSIVDSEFIQEVGPDYDFLSGDAGTGAYYLVESVTGVSQTFKRFDDWWGGTPYFETVIGKNYVDLTAMNIDYMNGDIDITMMNNSDSIARVLSGEITDTIYYNVDKNRMYGLCMATAADSILSDKNIRLALAHSIDMEEVVYACFGNNYEGSPCTKMYIDGTLYAKDVGEYEYDPELAVELLAAAGYGPGNPLHLKAVVGDSGVNSIAMETIAAYASAVGFDIDVTVTKATAATEAYNGRSWPSEYDMVLVPINSYNSGDPSDLFAGRIAYGQELGTFGALQGIDSKELSDLADASETMDAAEREQIFSEIQDLVHEEAWFIPLFTYSGGVFVRNYIHNVHLINGYSVYWADLTLE